MNITTYRKQRGLTQQAFAAFLTERGCDVSQSLVSLWEKGAANGGVDIPPERCRDIEVATRGECTRVANRPDVFGPLKHSRKRKVAGRNTA